MQASAQESVSAIHASEKALLDNTMAITNFTYAEHNALGEQLLLNAQGSGYLYLQARLNLTQTDLLRFIYLDRVSQQASHVTAGFDQLRHTGLVSTL